MATQTPERIFVDNAPRIISDREAMQELRGGLGNAAAYFHLEELAELAEELRTNEDGDHPAYHAWEEQVIDAAIEEIAPAVSDLLTAAIEKRLPWIWEQER